MPEGGSKGDKEAILDKVADSAAASRASSEGMASGLEETAVSAHLVRPRDLGLEQTMASEQPVRARDLGLEQTMASEQPVRARDLGLEQTMASEQPVRARDLGLELTMASEKPVRAREPALDKTELSAHPGISANPTAGGVRELGRRRGDTLGRYVVLDLLGKGGMGEVYAAYDPTLDRKVALKVLRPALDMGDGSVARARLTREAQAMAQLAHPNVIQVFDVGTIDGEVYVAMEFVDGMALREWLETQRTPSEILEIFTAAGKGLAAAHRAGMVHRDFKPDNVLIGKDGRVRVIDFGIASLGKDAQEDVDELVQSLSRSRQSIRDAFTTLTGAAVGTPAYMAPEQFRGELCDARTDQFNFGVALHEALYKQRPFSGSNVSELFVNLIEGNRSPPPENIEPAWLYGAIERAVQTKPEDRYESMDALLAALVPPETWLGKHRLPIALASLTTGIMGVVLSVFLLAGDSGPAPCQGEDKLLVGVWDDARKSELRAQFAKSSLPYATQVLDLALESLDDHSQKWLRARRDLCEAAVRKDVSADLRNRGMACLDRRLREVDAVTTILARADDDTIQNAALLVSEIASVDDCTNTTLLSSSASEPLPPEWSEISDRIPDLKATHTATRYDEVLRRATELRELAAARGFRMGEGEALFWQASAEQALGKHDEAYEHYFEVIRIGQTIDAPLLRAQAWTGLTSLAGVMDKPDDGLRWHKHAEIDNELAGVDPDLQALMTYLLGYSLYKSRDYDGALEKFRASAALYEKIYGPKHWRVSSNLSLASACLRALARHDEALAENERALAMAVQSLGPEHPRLAPLHNGAANALGRVKRFAEAREHYERARLLTIATNGPRHPSVSMYLFNQAGLEEKAGNYEEGLRLAKEALELRQEALGEKGAGVVRVLSTMASLHFKMGDLEEAIKLQSEVAKRYELINGAMDSSTADAHSMLCDLFRRDQKLDKARVSCDKALKFLDPDAPDPRNLAWALTHAAELDLEQGKPKIALERAQRAWKLRQEHASDPWYTAQTRFALAKALAASGDFAGALEHAKAARAELSDGPPGFHYDLPVVDDFLAQISRP